MAGEMMKKRSPFGVVLSRLDRPSPGKAGWLFPPQPGTSVTQQRVRGRTSSRRAALLFQPRQLQMQALRRQAEREKAMFDVPPHILPFLPVSTIEERASAINQYPREEAYLPLTFHSSRTHDLMPRGDLCFLGFVRISLPVLQTLPSVSRVTLCKDLNVPPHSSRQRQPSTLLHSPHHTPFNPRHAGASPRRPQLYGCPLHLSLKPFRIDNRDPGTWIKTAVCGVQSHGVLSLVSSPLPLPSLLTSPRCASTVYVHLHCVLSTKLPNVPPSKHLGLFQEHQWESKLGASYPRHSLPSNLGSHRRSTDDWTPATCTAPHRTALLCTTCSRAGSPDLMPSDISGTPVSRFFPSHLTAPHDTQHVFVPAPTSAREGPAEEPRPTSPPLFAVPEEAPSSTFDAVTTARDAVPSTSSSSSQSPLSPRRFPAPPPLRLLHPSGLSYSCVDTGHDGVKHSNGTLHPICKEEQVTNTMTSRAFLHGIPTLRGTISSSSHVSTRLGRPSPYLLLTQNTLNDRPARQHGKSSAAKHFFSEDYVHSYFLIFLPLSHFRIADSDARQISLECLSTITGDGRASSQAKSRPVPETTMPPKSATAGIIPHIQTCLPSYRSTCNPKQTHPEKTKKHSSSALPAHRRRKSAHPLTFPRIQAKLAFPRSLIYSYFFPLQRRGGPSGGYINIRNQRSRKDPGKDEPRRVHSETAMGEKHGDGTLPRVPVSGSHGASSFSQTFILLRVQRRGGSSARPVPISPFSMLLPVLIATWSEIVVPVPGSSAKTQASIKQDGKQFGSCNVISFQCHPVIASESPHLPSSKTRQFTLRELHKSGEHRMNSERLPSPPTTRRARSKATATYRKDHQDKKQRQQDNAVAFSPPGWFPTTLPGPLPFPIVRRAE
ncbi:uncharacterized protein CLUP02_12965 [Colletotrichum lupini]|uniref:Uncharacterized protein n=1 Tax=Colletotrichum lupini TaxID=145971 RepID=A0A9Q8T286_9PEZI|nr:uncharacterized protein CLUP02_12965 [Colletotrichum lupini]UQC87460.1 hypothetical protein CLUP02_12965 [Colletotrichum lupini]